MSVFAGSTIIVKIFAVSITVASFGCCEIVLSVVAVAVIFVCVVVIVVSVATFVTTAAITVSVDVVVVFVVQFVTIAAIVVSVDICCCCNGHICYCCYVNCLINSAYCCSNCPGIC